MLRSEEHKRARALLGVVLTVVVVGIAQSRPGGEQLFAGADSGGMWAEHVARLRVAQQTLDVQWSAGSFLDLVRAADERFPPALYLWGAAVGRWFGHSAEVACRSMAVWWLLVALAAGRASQVLGDRAPGSFFAGYAATLLVPAFGALSLTWFFDLPMIALLWCALAAWLSLEQRPVLPGLVAGLLLFAAGLMKWTALPMGGLMLAGLAATGLRRSDGARPAALAALNLAVAAATMGAAFAAYRTVGGTSFDHMLQMTAGATIDAVVHAVPVGPFSVGLVEFEGKRLAWYGVRLFTQILGPLAAPAFLIGVAAAGARPRRLALAMLLVVGGVCLFLIPPQDSRFLLPAAPALAIAAGHGCRRLGAKLAVPLVLLAGLTVAEFHHGPAGVWNQVWPASPRPSAPFTGRGVFLEVGDRGTSGTARAAMPPAWLPQREAIWQRLAACEPQVLVVPDDVFGRHGDSIWLGYRDLVAQLEEQPRPTVLLETGRGWGEGSTMELPAHAVLLLGDEGEGLPTVGDTWEPAGRWRLPNHGLVGLWTRGAGSGCPLDPPLERLSEPRTLELAGCAVGGLAAEELTAVQPPAELDRSDPCAWPDVGCSDAYQQAAASLGGAPDCRPLLDDLAAARVEDRSEHSGEPWSQGADWDAETLGILIERNLGLPDPSPLGRWATEPTPVPGGTRRDVLLEDPWLGRQRVMLLLPDGEGPHPGVVGLLGHGQSVEAFLEGHAGQGLLEAGVAVAVVVPRGYDDGEAEDRATRAMLCAGSSMVAARVREARNAMRALRAEPTVCANRIGLLAHSGGSLVANLLAWIQPDLRGIVTDMEGRYNGAREEGPGVALLRDETHPALRTMNLRIIEFADALVPTKRVRYGMPDGPEEVVAFFEAALRSDERVPQPPPLPPPQ